MTKGVNYQGLLAWGMNGPTVLAEIVRLRDKTGEDRYRSAHPPSHGRADGFRMTLHPTNRSSPNV
jgi:hypothetical protein